MSPWEQLADSMMEAKPEEPHGEEGQAMELLQARRIALRKRRAQHRTRNLLGWRR